MQLSALQIVLLVLVAAEINVDRRGLSLTHARPVIVGFLCGLILGDMNSGLYIGGTFTLMSLGVAALGVLPGSYRFQHDVFSKNPTSE